MADTSQNIKKNKVIYTASSQGIEKAEKALIRLGFESKSNFAKSQLLARSTVNKFFQGQPIQYDSFKRICEVLKLNLLEVAERIEEPPKHLETKNFNSQDTNEEVQTIKTQLTVIDQENQKTKAVIVLKGNIDSVNNISIIQAILQQYSGDTVKITDIKEGSIKLFVEGSPEDIERLVSLIKSGKITEINGFPVEEYIQILSESSNDDESNKLDNKWSLVQKIVKQGINGSNLSGVDLSDTDLSYTNLSDVNLNDANLSGTDLSSANLSGANLSDANLSTADLIAANLSGANLMNANLSCASLRDANLRSANLSGANLSKANLRGSDLNGANLSEVNFTDANLSRIQALATNFTAALLTGVCLEDWHINTATKLDDINCQYVYLKREKQERRPVNGEFKLGEFTKLFEKALETVDLIFADGIDWKAFLLSFQELQAEYGEENLSVQAIEKKSGGAFVIRLEVPQEVNKSDIEFREKELYQRHISLMEAQLKNQEVLLNHYNKILDDTLKKNTDFTGIIKTLADNTPTININMEAKAESKSMSKAYQPKYDQRNSNNQLVDTAQSGSNPTFNQYNYTSEQKKTLAESASEIQKLLKQLEQTNPTATETEKVTYVNDETTSSFKRRVVGALQAGGETAIDEFILENKYLKVAKAAIKGWLQPGS